VELNFIYDILVSLT